MTEEEGESAWHEVLRARLESTGRSDDSVIEFIENEVPDEGEILDFKQDLYLSADPPHHDKKRQATLMKHFSALANVRTPARFRYLFVGFNDEGQFIGMQYRDPMGGNQILDVDDADLRNVFTDKVSPSPNFDIFELEKDGGRGGVIVIRQGEQVPLVIEHTLRRNDGTAFVHEGQAYTRDGSQTARMGSDDFAGMMRYREELITGKIQELTEGLSQVVGIPDDQLANLDLSVTQSEDGVPIQELVTMDAPKSIDEELKTAVKGSKGSGGYEYQRRGLYEFLAHREDIDLNDEGDQKIEFLVRASLKRHFHGAYWLAHYDDNLEELIEMVLEEDVNGITLPPLERILLVLGKRSYLNQIDDNEDWSYGRSKAEQYATACSNATHLRVIEYIDRTEISVRETSYSIEDLVYGRADADLENLINSVVDNLLEDDDGVDRTRLRELELIYLAANS